MKIIWIGIILLSLFGIGFNCGWAVRDSRPDPSAKQMCFEPGDQIEVTPAGDGKITITFGVPGSQDALSTAISTGPTAISTGPVRDFRLKLRAGGDR